MFSFSKTISIRWADLDPNFHLRHSVYYDFGSQLRIEILEELGLTMSLMQQQQFGPIIFREECIFRKEIRLGDVIMINAELAKMKADASRWTIRHQFINAENKLRATLNIDGSWLNTSTRKLLSPIPELVIKVFNFFPKSDDFIAL